MNTKDFRMEEWKLLSFMSLLSNYDYFLVRKENEPEFHATKIERSCGAVLKFGRKFATPVYSEGELKNVVALSEAEFKCQIGNFTYHIRALHHKPDDLPVCETHKWNCIDDMANIKYLNVDQSSYMKENGLLILVVDPNQIGDLSEADEAKIKSLINVKLHGNGKGMQVCRTICFECKINDPQRRIYAGMFDMENGVPRSSVMVYNASLAQSMEEEIDERYVKLWDFAQTVYGEKFL